MSDKETNCNKSVRRLPVWLKRPLGAGDDYVHVEHLLRDLHLHTVCRSAQCPNLGKCWSAGTATFMILGNVCTRRCKFCAVSKGAPEPIEADEPVRVAKASAAMNLKHVVVTSVTRDDLSDEGANHFAQTIVEIRKALPEAAIEVLTPDFHAKPELLDIVGQANPTIFNHNLETTRELSPTIRPQANYQRSLTVLKYMREHFPKIYIKSGLMVGLGENDDQIHRSLIDLANAGCQLITVGQYLAPSKDHYPVQNYLPPEWFDELTAWAKENLKIMGFAASPFVRSSYLAHELIKNIPPQNS
jgi:lipoic acid synthetase